MVQCTRTILASECCIRMAHLHLAWCSCLHHLHAVANAETEMFTTSGRCTPAMFSVLQHHNCAVIVQCAVGTNILPKTWVVHRGPVLCAQLCSFVPSLLLWVAEPVPSLCSVLFWRAGGCQQCQGATRPCPMPLSAKMLMWCPPRINSRQLHSATSLITRTLQTV